MNRDQDGTESRRAPRETGRGRAQPALAGADGGGGARWPAYGSGGSMPLEWKIFIVAIVFAAGFHVITNYLYIVIGVQIFPERGRLIFEFSGYVVGAIVCIGALAAFLPGATSRAIAQRSISGRRWHTYEYALFALVALTPVWALTGFLHAAPFRYLVGDTYRLMVFPLAYFILTVRPNPLPRKAFYFIIGMSVIMGLIESGVIFYAVVAKGGRNLLSFSSCFTFITYVLLKRKRHWWDILLVAVFVLAMVLSLKRTMWYTLVYIPTITLILRPQGRSLIFLGLSLLLVYVVLAYVRLGAPTLYHGTERVVQDRWRETMEDMREKTGELDLEGGGRLGELRGVVDLYRRSAGPVEYILGFGLGVFYPLPTGHRKHHVHSAYGAFLLRTGPLGLFLVLLFIGSFTFHLIRETWRRRNSRMMEEWELIWRLFLIIMIPSLVFGAIHTTAFWGDISLPFAIAMLYHAEVNRRARERPAPADRNSDGHGPDAVEVRDARQPDSGAPPGGGQSDAGGAAPHSMRTDSP